MPVSSSVSSATEAGIVPPRDVPERGSAWEVLRIFTRLGFTCFGGPIAHIGYFRDEFVTRRSWLNEEAFADLVGLCQFLPGPASSKLGFSIGILRGGYLGGAAAWLGFTLPSALILFAFAGWVDVLAGNQQGMALIHGLKLVAVAIVAQAVLGMARNLCPDRQRTAIAVVAASIAMLAPTAISQIGGIVLGGLVGMFVCRSAKETLPDPLNFGIGKRTGVVCAILFAVLLSGSFLVHGNSPFAMCGAFYKAGALVFGGGHVVLPLLDQTVVAQGWAGREFFLSGYGAAQAVPGPLFTFAAFLGASPAGPVSGAAGAALALATIFLPGLLLQLAALPFWDSLRGRPRMQAVIRGINAAVVGILGAALYSPVWTSSVLRPIDFIIALASFVLLISWKARPILVVAFCAIASCTAVALSI